MKELVCVGLFIVFAMGCWMESPCQADTTIGKLLCLGREWLFQLIPHVISKVNRVQPHGKTGAGGVGFKRCVLKSDVYITKIRDKIDQIFHLCLLNSQCNYFSMISKF